MSIRHLASLLQPRSIALIGAPAGVLHEQLATNLAASVNPQRTLEHCSGPVWPACELAVALDAKLVAASNIAPFAAAGGRAVLWAADAPVPEDFLQACRPARVRVLGPRSCGVARPGTGFNGTWLAQTPLAGSVALIAQSRSVAAAVVDFAQGRRLGFSWLAVTGAECDVDVADLLDHAALDPQTRAVVLQLGHIGEARKFMSAARAAARAKPVVVLQSPRAGETLADPVRSCAFARAGLVECDDLDGLFDALAALDRLPALRECRVALAGNGAGLCALGSRALARHGLPAALLNNATRAQLERLYPATRCNGAAVDLGEASANVMLDCLRVLLGDPAVDLLVLVHGPGTRCPQLQLATELATAQLGNRLLAVWPGLDLAAAARAASAAAGVATFASAEQAARAVRYRRQHDLNRVLLTQTPPDDGTAAPDRARCTQLLEKYRGGSPVAVSAPDAAAMLDAYGLKIRAAPAAVGAAFECTLARHPELGMDLRLAPAQDESAAAFALPPLDALLASRMLLDAGVRAGPSADALAQALIRLGRLSMEQPLLAAAQLALAVMPGADIATVLPGARLTAENPAPERQRLALAPYPAALEQVVTLRHASRYRVRAIRPADEPALIGLLERLNPEEVRYRFFIHLRHFSHEMAARMTQIDYDRELALVAFAEDRAWELAGTATLIADAGGGEAEFAVLVHHAHAGRGLGRHLLSQLLAHATAKGIVTVVGDVLADNVPMLSLAARLGFVIKADPLDPSCRRVEKLMVRGPAP